MVGGRVNSIATIVAMITASLVLSHPPSAAAQASGTFTAVGSMNDARQFFTATRLADGSVLVAGGLGKAGYLDSAEPYDPLTQTFKYTGSMSIRRDLHVSTLLADGRVLVTGGISQKGRNSRTVAAAEIFDPRKGKFAPTGSMAVPRAQHTATLLNNGKV